MAWHSAVLQRMDIKKFPKTPESIWGSDQGQALDSMVEVAKSMKAAQEGERKKEKAETGKKKEKKKK